MSRSHQRSNLTGRNFHPEIAIRHPVVYTSKVHNFFADIEEVLDDIIPKTRIETGLTVINELAESQDPHEQRAENAEPSARFKKHFRVYDDPKRIGVTILERRFTREFAQKHRLHWSARDVGRINGDIQDEIAQLKLLDSENPDKPIEATFKQAIRIPTSGGLEQGRKIGLIVDQSNTIAEFFVREHELSVDGITSSIKNFRRPYDEFIPRLPIGRIFKEVRTEDLNSCVRAIQGLLPLTLELERVKFFAEQEI